MRLNDGGGIDPNYKEIVIFFNARPAAVTFTDTALAGDYVLHPIQQNSADEVVKQSSYTDNTFNVPGRTTAVFVIEKVISAPSAEPTATTTPATESNSNSLTLAGIIAALLAITGLGIYLRRKQQA